MSVTGNGYEVKVHGEGFQYAKMFMSMKKKGK